MRKQTTGKAVEQAICQHGRRGGRRGEEEKEKADLVQRIREGRGHRERDKEEGGCVAGAAGGLEEGPYIPARAINERIILLLAFPFFLPTVIGAGYFTKIQ